MTVAEEVEARVPEQYKPPVDRAMTPEEYMSHEMAKSVAREKARVELGLDDEDFIDEMDQFIDED